MSEDKMCKLTKTVHDDSQFEAMLELLSMGGEDVDLFNLIDEVPSEDGRELSVRDKLNLSGCAYGSIDDIENIDVPEARAIGAKITYDMAGSTIYRMYGCYLEPHVVEDLIAINGLDLHQLAERGISVDEVVEFRDNPESNPYYSFIEDMNLTYGDGGWGVFEETNGDIDQWWLFIGFNASCVDEENIDSYPSIDHQQAVDDILSHIKR